MKLKHFPFILCLLFVSTAFSQDAKAIFEKAADRLLLNNMELSIEVNEIRKNGRVKEKAFDVVLGKFDDADRIKMYMQKPERAKGVTIVVTNAPDDTGLIEILTPANGKIRKMKATPKNLELVGSGGFSSNYLNVDPEELNVTYLGKENSEGRLYTKLEVQEKMNPEQGKAQILIDVETYDIVKIISFTTDGTLKDETTFSDFKTIAGTNKVYPRRVVTIQAKDASKTEIEIFKVKSRPNLKKSDFMLQNSPKN